MPYELAPDAAMEGENLYDYLPAEEIEDSLNRLNGMGKELGIHFNNKNKKFNTRKAHLAGYYAKEKGLYDAYSRKVFEAYFVHGNNIAQTEVLDQIASEVGLDVDEMNKSLESDEYIAKLMADFEIADRNVVNVVPTFIVGDDLRFSGIAPYKDFKRMFEDL